ncbi:DNA cytosine methyltransferase [Pseudoclavibacter endophyticus]|uniref:Cytosine-specific methyltransferase n=1 Tax=Pseudoclavibacter endophyticus TaxID=1778590 RepID=A0A6H9WQM5_9MICO|nr:DNA (cytosine-5-)-methyltransferase [Pseudoclavibacter endophyticus]KAB1648355.1 DNA cytosine methyltransferase [Pseudoclavibacter endophyticus]GGA71953.1 DNA cytosine methyltransferase [Pseudoclavibacter endophyticus]
MDGKSRSTELTAVEICAGAGGQSLGLHLAGFRHVLAVELDRAAAETLDRNLTRLASEEGTPRPVVAVGDVADRSVWEPEDYRGVSLLAGGVPCPPFSIAGKQLGTSDERDLFAWAVEAAGRMQPDAVLLENVRGLSMPRFAGYRQAVLDRFAELGYRADWRLLEAKDFGVPQLRPRFILVALREEFAPYFSWPEPTPAAQTVGSALYDLMAANGWAGAEEWAKRADRVAPTIVGGSKKHGGPDLGPTRAKREWRAIGVDGLGIADAAPGPHAPLDLVPKLTNEMVARIQGWAGPGYEWDFGDGRGRKTATYRQIGNAFPPPVARAVGLAIASALRKETRSSGDDHGARSQYRDEVYRVLRDREGFVSLPALRKAVGGALGDHEIERRIEFLRRDFDIEVRRRGSYPAYRLGEWRAFRGQGDHSRHLAFATERLRSKIS